MGRLSSEPEGLGKGCIADRFGSYVVERACVFRMFDGKQVLINEVIEANPAHLLLAAAKAAGDAELKCGQHFGQSATAGAHHYAGTH